MLATGSTILLTTGMIDLSIGSLIALCTMVLAGLLNHGGPPCRRCIGTIASAPRSAAA